MTKARVSFLIDTDLLHLPSDIDLLAFVRTNIVAAARAHHMGKLRVARQEGGRGVKSAFGAMTLTLMAEANLAVEEVSVSTAVETMLPHERERER